jgi:hypothetical protein
MEKQAPHFEPAADDGIAMQRKLRKAILQKLDENYGGLAAKWELGELTIMVTDSLFYGALTRSDFVQTLPEKLGSETRYSFECIKLVYATQWEEGYSPVGLDCYMKLETTRQQAEQRCATLTLVPGLEKGSLVQPSYRLDSHAIADLPAQRYNIGRGEQNKFSDGHFRINQIAISNDPLDPHYQTNRRISRSQAHIAFDPKEGFLLYVDEGGRRDAKGRTEYIHPGSQKEELTLLDIPEPLHDGTYIILNRAITLLYHDVER